MDETGDSRLTAWVLILLTILGIVIFTILNPPSDTAVVSTDTNTPQVSLTFATPILAPAVAGPLVAANANETNPQSPEAAQTAAVLAAEREKMETARQVEQATAEARGTQAALNQMQENALSTRVANSQKMMAVSSTQVANEQTRKNLEITASRERTFQQAVLVLSVSVGVGLLLVAAGWAVYWYVDAQRQNKLAKTALHEAEYKRNLADTQRIEAQRKLIEERRKLLDEQQKTWTAAKAMPQPNQGQPMNKDTSNGYHHAKLPVSLMAPKGNKD